MEKAHGLLLLSGGIDSPVAGFLAGRKTRITALHFSNEDFAGTESVEKAKKISKKLKFKKLIVIDLSKQLREIAEKCSPAYYFVLQRRLMLRVAEKVAVKEKCDFVVTGDSLGQVSSQTLANMSIISRAARILVARPLLGFNKLETTRLAEEIGTLEISKGPEMCDVLGPKHPSTHASLERIEEEEGKLEIDSLVKTAVSQVKQDTPRK